MPRLVISAPGLEDRTFEFEGGVITIGRDESCSVQIDEAEAEPTHCQIEADEAGRFKLVDLETRAGTEVDFIKVNAHLLESGDRIRIGAHELLFEAAPEAERRARAAAPSRLRRRPRTEGRRRGEEVAEGLPILQEPAPSEVAEELMEERETLLRLLDISKLLTSEHSLKKLLELVMDTLIEMTGAERGFLILKEKEGLVVKVARNFDRESIRKPEFKVSHSVAEQVLRSGRPMLSANAQEDPGIPTEGSVSELKLRSLLCIPFSVRETVLGCVYMDNRFESGLFSEGSLPLLRGFAEQAAIAIENARLFEENARREEELRRSRDEIARLNHQLRDKVEKQYVELSKVRQDLDARRPEQPLRHDFSSLIGRSRALQDVLRVLDRVLDTDEPVFVHGESGTGKELVARAIHFNSPRSRSGRFVSENCSAIPDTLLESELFGHEKGAFTGATASKPGLFELAHKGTLFLDEIGDMSVDMQKKLLRALQEGEIRRVGGKDVLKVDVRIISASNKDLSDLIRTGAFREDLYYRLHVVKVTLPPLRRRREDVPLLADFFLDRIARESGQPKRTLEEPAWWSLQHYDWPGNVRELENELRRAVALSDDVITVDHLKEEIRARPLAPAVPAGDAPGTLKDAVKAAVEAVERRLIGRTLDECAWKKSEAALRLGVSRPTLDAKIQQYGLARKPEGS